MDISTAISPGNNNVFIPFEETITKSLSANTKKASDMTMADRIRLSYTYSTSQC